jgi:hypothetical protein
MSMATTTTMTSPTWFAFHDASMPGSTHENEWRMAVTFDKRSRSGVARLMPRKLSEPLRSRCSPTRLNGNARAVIVAVLSARDILTRCSVALHAQKLFRTLHARFAASGSVASLTAPSVCGPVHISAVGRSDERTLVYNLTVADAHLFYANGVLSSNTDMEDHAPDSVRYAAASRPFVRDAEKPVIEDSWSRAFERAAREEQASGWRVA